MEDLGKEAKHMLNDVEDGQVVEPNEEISLSEARKIEPDFEVGEDVSEEVKLIDLGRRAILAEANFIQCP